MTDDLTDLEFHQNLVNAAAMLRVFYEALINEDFDESQAFDITLQFEITWFESLLNIRGHDDE